MRSTRCQIASLLAVFCGTTLLAVSSCAPDSQKENRRTLAAGEADRSASDATGAASNQCSESFAQFTADIDGGGPFLERVVADKGRVLYCLIFSGVQETNAYDNVGPKVLNDWNRLLIDHPYWPYKKDLDVKVVHTTDPSGAACNAAGVANGTPNAVIIHKIEPALTECRSLAAACAQMSGNLIFSMPSTTSYFPIVHEMGHILGFADAYSDGSAFNWNTSVQSRSGPTVMNNSQSLTHDDKAGIWFQVERMRNVGFEKTCGLMGNTLTMNSGGFYVAYMCIPGSTLDSSVVQQDLNPQVTVKPGLYSGQTDPYFNLLNGSVQTFATFTDLKWRVDVASPDLDADIKTAVVRYDGASFDLFKLNETRYTKPFWRKQMLWWFPKFSKIGPAKIEFEVTDTKGRRTLKTLTVNIISSLPEVNLPEVIYLKPGAMGQAKIDFTKILPATDASSISVWCNEALFSTSGRSCGGTYSSDPSNAKIGIQTFGPFPDNSVASVIISFSFTNKGMITTTNVSRRALVITSEAPLIDAPLSLKLLDMQTPPHLHWTVPKLGSKDIVPVSWAVNRGGDYYVFDIAADLASAGLQGWTFSPAIFDVGIFDTVPKVNNWASIYFTSEIFVLASSKKSILYQVKSPTIGGLDRVIDDVGLDSLLQGRAVQHQGAFTGILKDPSTGAVRILRPKIQTFEVRNPTVAFSQTDSMSLNQGETLRIPVQVASYAGGSVGSVRFYTGSQLLYETKQEPYFFDYKFTKAGDYEIRTVSVDDLGQESNWEELAAFSTMPEYQHTNPTWKIHVEAVTGYNPDTASDIKSDGIKDNGFSPIGDTLPIDSGSASCK